MSGCACRGRGALCEFLRPWASLLWGHVSPGVLMEARFHGPPGNGKTISIKATMHSLYDRSPPVPTLYVKTLAG